MARIACFVLVLLFCFTSISSSMERFGLVTTEELSDLLTAREDGKIDFLLVNALDEVLFLDKSIPGSISLPWSRIDEESQRLGSDKNKLIITYCMGYR